MKTKNKFIVQRYSIEVGEIELKRFIQECSQSTRTNVELFGVHHRSMFVGCPRSVIPNRYWSDKLSLMCQRYHPTDRRLRFVRYKIQLMYLIDGCNRSRSSRWGHSSPTPSPSKGRPRKDSFESIFSKGYFLRNSNFQLFSLLIFCRLFVDLCWLLSRFHWISISIARLRQNNESFHFRKSITWW